MIFGAADNNDSDSDCIPTCEQSFQFAVIPPRRSTNRRYESCVRDLKEAGQVRRPARSVKDQDDVQILQDLGKPCCSKRRLRAFLVPLSLTSQVPSCYTIFWQTEPRTSRLLPPKPCFVILTVVSALSSFVIFFSLLFSRSLLSFTLICFVESSFKQH